ncbi:hypothetical protein AMTR_s00090p00157790 [Amborella trichopoda]|uniref:Uncharacterized protein n=1 Tax=Amborella trichopoda TaxID=13333 RepID=W1P425_AMBTC|nr:hypothetical protein AMTR_s00090p00157790 [Amborella trichopoda]
MAIGHATMVFTVGGAHGGRRGVMGARGKAGERTAVGTVKTHGDRREGEKARGDRGGNAAYVGELKNGQCCVGIAS